MGPISVGRAYRPTQGATTHCGRATQREVRIGPLVKHKAHTACDNVILPGAEHILHQLSVPNLLFVVVKLQAKWVI